MMSSVRQHLAEEQPPKLGAKPHTLSLDCCALPHVHTCATDGQFLQVTAEDHRSSL